MVFPLILGMCFLVLLKQCVRFCLSCDKNPDTCDRMQTAIQSPRIDPDLERGKAGPAGSDTCLRGRWQAGVNSRVDMEFAVPGEFVSR